MKTPAPEWNPYVRVQPLWTAAELRAWMKANNPRGMFHGRFWSAMPESVGAGLFRIAFVREDGVHGCTLSATTGLPLREVAVAAPAVDPLLLAIATMRDTILNGRHQMAENGMTSEQINDVLGVIDDNLPDGITLPEV
jgi:hypothetical protein